MLCSTIDGLWTPTIFEFPEKPLTDEGEIKAMEAASLAAAWTYDKVPFQPNGPYRADLAENSGGNCYAVAESIASILSNWKVLGNFIVIEYDDGSSHASNAMVTSRGALYIDGCVPPVFEQKKTAVSHSDIINPVEKTFISVRHPHREAPLQIAHKAFFESLAQGAPSTEGRARYFWFDDDEHLHTQDWSDRSTGMREIEFEPEADNRSLHLIAEAPLGIAILHAMGDAKRYAITNPDKLKQRLGELSIMLPVFSPIFRASEVPEEVLV